MLKNENKIVIDKVYWMFSPRFLIPFILLLSNPPYQKYDRQQKADSPRDHVAIHQHSIFASKRIDRGDNEIFFSIIQRDIIFCEEILRSFRKSMFFYCITIVDWHLIVPRIQWVWNPAPKLPEFRQSSCSHPNLKML